MFMRTSGTTHITLVLFAILACTGLCWAASVSQAVTHFKAGQFAEAAAMLEQVIEDDPTDLTAQFWLGRARYEAGDLEGAQAAFSAVLAVKPQSTETRYWLARLYEKQGKIAQARAEAARILDQAPEHKLTVELAARLKTAREDTTGVYYPEGTPSFPGGRRVAIDWGALKGDVGAVDVLSSNVYDYTFSNAPSDWFARSGQWAITNRWTCSPQWSWQGGYAEDGIASIWNKREFAGDVVVEAYLAFKMGLGTVVNYKNPNDLNITIHGDGANPSSGYSFMVGADHNSESRIVKGTHVLAASSDPKALLPVFEDGFPSTYEFHRRWWRVRARKVDTKLQLWLDDQLVVEAEDPEPLNAGHVGLWIQDNGMIVSRVKVYYEQENETRGPVPGEDAILAPRPRVADRLFTIASSSHLSVQNDFEADLGTWAPMSDTDPVSLRIVDDGPDGKGHCLAITNTVPGGKFAARVTADKVELTSIPRLSFDYKLPADGGVKANLYLTVDGRLCEVIFSGPPEGTPQARRLGQISGVVADGQWHHAQFDLLNAVRSQFGAEAAKVQDIWLGNLCTGVPPVTPADAQPQTAHQEEATVAVPPVAVRTDGYLMAGFGGNQLGATYYLDNFCLDRPAGPEVKLAFTPQDGVELSGYSVAMDGDPFTEAPEQVSVEEPAAALKAEATEGALYAHVRARTADGEWTATQHYQLHVDQSPPQVLAVSPPAGSALSDGPIEIQLSDPGGSSVDLESMKLTVNGNAIPIDGQTAVFDVGTGTIALDARRALTGVADGSEVRVSLATLSDRAGNRMSSAPEWTYRLDFAEDKVAPPPPVIHIGADGLLCAEDFETSLGGFTSYQGSNGAELSLDDTTAASGRRSLRVYNRAANSSFGTQIRSEPFDAGKYRLVSFDYKVPPRLRVDFMVYVNGDWKAIRFKDTDNDQGYIGEIPAVVDDNRWHHAEIDLYQMLRKDDPTAPSLTVRQFIISDNNWKANVEGQTYHLDNFRIASVVSAAQGLKLAWQAPDISGTFGLSYTLGPAVSTEVPAEVKLEGSEATLQDVGDADGWLSARVRDGAGNWSEPSAWRVQVDCEAPSAAAVSPAVGQAVATSLVEVALTDAGPAGIDPASVVLDVGGQDYTVDNQALTYDAQAGKLTWNCEAASPEPVVLPDGKLVEVKLKSAGDYAGNPVATALAWNWTMDYKQDKTPPTLKKLLSRTHPTTLTQTFEDGLSGWRNMGGEAGATVELDTTTAASGVASVKLTQKKEGGTMAAYITTEPFLADRYPLLSFDYMLSPKARLDLVAHMANGKEYPVAFSDNPTGAIGSVSGVKADGKWRHAAVDLQALLRRQETTGALEVKYLYVTDRNNMENAVGTTASFDNVVVGQIGTRSPVFHWEATDTTGVAGYSYVIDREPGTTPDETPEGAERSQRSFPKLEKGRWYFHIRALDGAGNWSPATHYAIMHLTAE